MDGSMSRHVFSIANYFLNKDYPLSLLQVNKLCYIAFGYYGALTNGKKLFDQEISAYEYGPVIPELYEKLKEQHSDLAEKKYSDGFLVDPVSDHAEEIDGKDILLQKILDFVHSRYHHLDGIKLSQLTHKAGTPWKNHYKEGKKEKIPHEEIIAYFRSLIIV